MEAEKKNGDEKIPLFNRLLLECQEVSRLITHSMDEPLTLRQRLLVRWHLLVCRYCRKFQKQLFWLRKILQSKSKMTDKVRTNDVGLSNEAKERIKEVLKRKSD